MVKVSQLDPRRLVADTKNKMNTFVHSGEVETYTTLHSAILWGAFQDPFAYTLGLTFKFSQSLSSLSCPQGESLLAEQQRHTPKPVS